MGTGAEETERIGCMEIWGGNRTAQRDGVLAGLDAWVRSLPQRGHERGGDVHYVSACATGRITRILVADVSGHGETASEASRTLRELMRRHVNHLDQRRFVGALNREFGGVSGGDTFATAVVGTFFAPTRHLAVSNAGHPPPLVYRSRPRRWAALARRGRGQGPANLPLGVLDAAAYDQLGLTLRVGDLLLCYTDGLADAHGADGRPLGTSGLLEIVRKLDAEEPQELLDRLLDAVVARDPDALARDDVTALLLRCNGRDALVPLGRRLLAPLRMLASVGAAVVRPGRPPPLPDARLANVGGALLARLGRLWHGSDAETRWEDDPEEGA